MSLQNVKGSIQNLASTTQDHFEYIQQQKSFTRGFPIHFELAYSDFRIIQFALELSGENTSLLNSFTDDYQTVYQYEDAYATGGLEGYEEKFNGQIDAYQQAKDRLLDDLQEISKLVG